MLFGPGPGEYQQESGQDYIGATAPAWTIQASRDSANKQSDVGPGQYEEHRNFGSDA